MGGGTSPAELDVEAMRLMCASLIVTLHTVVTTLRVGSFWAFSFPSFMMFYSRLLFKQALPRARLGSCVFHLFHSS